MIKNLLVVFLLLCCFTVFGQVPLPNPSFENWSVISGNTKDLPESWNSVNSTVPGWQASLLAQTVFREANNPHTGAYCAHTKTANPPLPGYPKVNGLIATGIPNSTTNGIDGGIPYTLRPDSFAGYYRATPVGADHATFEFCLRNADGTDTVGIARFDAPNTAVGSWTRFSAPIVYRNTNTPVQGTTLLSSSNGLQAVTGSEMWVDDIELIFNPTGIAPILAIKNFATVNVANNYLNIQLSTNLKANIQIVDMAGRIIYNEMIVGNQPIDISSYCAGIYTYVLYCENEKQTGKISVQ
jgi:hypothetical protein